MTIKKHQTQEFSLQFSYCPFGFADRFHQCTTMTVSTAVTTKTEICKHTM